MDRLLQKHVMTMFGVKKRTLQGWLRAGLIPNTIRTKGGHYRIRSPKGMTAAIYSRAVKIFTSDFKGSENEAIRRLGQEGIGYKTPHLVKRSEDSGVPQSWWEWQARIAENVRSYNALMRPIRRHCRPWGGAPFYRLDDLKKEPRMREREKRAWSKRA
jgi:hypothetical protein